MRDIIEMGGENYFGKMCAQKCRNVKNCRVFSLFKNVVSVADILEFLY